jgi:hypothetical protein
VDDGIVVPLLLIRPQAKQPMPVVIAIAAQGKNRFLTDRAAEIEALVRAGVAVCLPDLRATGETAPPTDRGDGGAYQRIAQMEFDLGRNLLGSRLKDLRTLIAHLRRLQGIDRQRIALWGDSFAPPNPANLRPDELEYEGAQNLRRAEPMGAHLSLLGALYEDGVRAVAARGGLSGYLTVLESPFAYVPVEDVILGVLKAGDVPDIAAAIAPRPLLLDSLVDGRNILVEEGLLERTLGTTREAYDRAGAKDRLTLRSEPREIGSWLATQLK